MKITFLGTSAGIPTKNRYVSALALQLENSREWMLFDCGEGTQYRLMQTSLSSFNLSKIFITHLHGDHIYGIFGLLASRGLSRAEKEVEIYGPSGIKELLETVLRLSQLNLPFEMNVTEIEDGDLYRFEKFSVEVRKLSHSITTFGFIVTEAEKEGRFDVERARRAEIPEGPLYGRLKRGESVTLADGRRVDGKSFIGAPRRGKRVIIGGDNDKPSLFEEYNGVDLMIHEATYTQRDFEKLPRKFMHSTAKSVAVAASNMGAKRLILTHISPRYDKEGRVFELLEEAKSRFDGDVEVAYDLMSVEI
ncbi:ribonuclease Z [Hydrogenimonas sp.]|nr:ribonuclease Z [Hydrogenimonas sp.]